jgi:hypothetical protein
MANRENHESKELANRLRASADGIVNAAASGLERDLRAAAALIDETDRPTQPFIPVFVSQLAKIANTTTDSDTALKLRRLLGEAQ